MSLIDLVATLVEVAPTSSTASLHGTSLASILTRDDPDWKDEALSEYLAHGATSPIAMLRKGRYKVNYVRAGSPALYDLEEGPAN